MTAIHLTKENFKEEVLESKVPVIVDFWATWYGPCQMLAPIIAEAAAEIKGAKIGKVEVDEQSELAREYKVMSVPTLIVFKDGKPVKRQVGVIPKEAVLELAQ